MNSDTGGWARERLLAEVGGIFSNTQRSSVTCAVCTGPSGAPLCPQCRAHRETFGDRLADLVLPLAYVRGRMRPAHQSEHHMYGYKGIPPAPKCRRDLLLMVFAATSLHGDCIAKAVGSRWDAVTFVPSVNRPGRRDHPIAQLADQVISRQRPVWRPTVIPGPGASQVDRTPRADGFAVAASDREPLAGRHVLVVEDTWVSGAKAQSVAVALKDASASVVTVLAIGRWLRYDWKDHKAFIDSLCQPYDALVCPLTGVRCPN